MTVTPKHTKGTKVRKFFPGHGWFDGSIIAVDEEDMMYTVQYNDGDKEDFNWDEAGIDKIVHHASAPYQEKKKQKKAPTDTELEAMQVHVAGIKVRRHYSRLEGKIETYNATTKAYEIAWENGIVEVISAGSEVDAMVEVGKRARTPGKKATNPTQISSTAAIYARLGPPLSDEQRNELMGIPIDLNDMYDFLTVGQQLGKGSVDHFVRQVSKMIEGVGITCIEWDDDVMFRPNPSLLKDLSVDVNKLRKKAEKHESKYGNAKKGGTLILNPLAKLQQYQRYYYYNKLLPKLTTIFQSKRIPPLVDEQRIELKGNTLDLEDMKRFLSETQSLSKLSVLHVIRQVKKLMNGQPITCGHWDNGSEFRVDPIKDLSVDVSKLKARVNSLASVRGLCCSGLLIMSPLQRLAEYQSYFYNKHHKVTTEE